MTTDAADALPTPRRLHVETDGPVTVIRFAGSQSDGQSVRELFEYATALTYRTGTRLLIDLCGLVLATSGLMGMLATIHKRMLASGGRLAVAVPDPRMMEAFQLTRLDTLLTLCPDTPTARARLA